MMTTDRNAKEYEECLVNMEFPTKAECKQSLLRKRRARTVSFYKNLRASKINYLYGPAPIDSNGDIADDYHSAKYMKWSWRGQRSKYIKKRCVRQSRNRYKHKRYYNNDLSISHCRGLYRRETEFWWELD